MAVTPPPSVTPAPTPPPQRGEKATFSTRVDAFVVWLTSAVAEFNAIVTNVYNNAVDAFNSATGAAQSASNALTSANNAASSASAASVTAGATLWASGQTVSQDQAKISPLDRRTYRRKTATAVSNIDPSLDSTNYVLLSADASSYILLGTAEVISPVANIDFLNLFNDIYLKYVIEVEGISPSSGLQLRIAASGAVDSSDSYKVGSNTSSSVSVGGATPSFSVTLWGMRTSDAAKAIGDSATWVNTSKASGARLFLQSGQFTNGSVRVYGIRR